MKVLLRLAFFIAAAAAAASGSRFAGSGFDDDLPLPHHYSAVTNFSLVDFSDASPSSFSPSVALGMQVSLNNNRTNRHGHLQPHTSKLLFSFSAHQKNFRFVLDVDHHALAPGVTFDLFDEHNRKIAEEIPSVRSYTGVMPAEEGSKSPVIIAHVVVHPNHVHALLREGSTLFSFDPLSLHQDRLSPEQLQELQDKTEEGMVCVQQSLSLVKQLLEGSLNNSPVKNLSELEQSTTASTTATSSPRPAARRALLATATGNLPPLPSMISDCWPGQYKGKRLLMGMALDVHMYQQVQPFHKEFILSLLSDANLIFGPQLNIWLTLQKTQIMTKAGGVEWNDPAFQASGEPSSSSSTSPLKLGICDSSLKSSSNILAKFATWHKRVEPNSAGIWHLVSGCHLSDAAGVAYVGCTCRTACGHAVTTSAKGPDRMWTTFAHECGHTLGAEHSFEEGEKKTGGIMDYGDSTLQGKFQFNVKYRKVELCEALTQSMLKGSYHDYGRSSTCYTDLEPNARAGPGNMIFPVSPPTGNNKKPPADPVPPLTPFSPAAVKPVQRADLEACLRLDLVVDEAASDEDKMWNQVLPPEAVQEYRLDPANKNTNSDSGVLQYVGSTDPSFSFVFNRYTGDNRLPNITPLLPEGIIGGKTWSLLRTTQNQSRGSPNYKQTDSMRVAFKDPWRGNDPLGPMVRRQGGDTCSVMRACSTPKPVVKPVVKLEKWRSDGKCGQAYPSPAGGPGECNGFSNKPCCSSHISGECGMTDAHCKCSDCENFFDW